MDLIERYIYAVTKHLPVDQQADVADELLDIIEGDLEEKGGHSKKNVKTVLQSLGDPEILAQKYKGGTQYLIGPKLYPIYVRALKLTYAIGMPIVFFIALISQIVDQPETINGFITAVIGILVTAAIQMVFWATLVFFIFERTNVTEKDLHANKIWTPDMLPEVKAKRQIPASEAVADMVWYGLLVLSPFIAQTIIAANVDGQITPIFNPQIGLLWSVIIIAFGLIGLLKSILKFRLRNWTPALTVFNVIFALLISTALITLPLTTQLINPAFATLLDTHINTADLAEIQLSIAWTVGISIAVTIGIYLYDAFNSIRLSLKLKK